MEAVFPTDVIHALRKSFENSSTRKLSEWHTSNFTSNIFFPVRLIALKEMTNEYCPSGMFANTVGVIDSRRVSAVL